MSPRTVVARLAAVLVSSLFAAGCLMSASADDPRDLDGPRGGTARLELTRGGGAVTGELIEVRGDSALILLGEHGYLVAALRHVRHAQIGPTVVSRNGEPIAAAHLDAVRLLARHPYGLEVEQLATLLRLRGQVALQELGADGALLIRRAPP